MTCQQLLLPAPPANYKAEEPKAGIAAFATSSIEAAGKGFEIFFARKFGKKVEAPVSPMTPTSPVSPLSRDPSGSFRKKKEVKTIKLTEEELAVDHYEILGLKELEFRATDEDIKAAYKIRVVETHPDKLKGSGAGDDTLFKQVQCSYEILNNPEKRLAYDSTLPFDEEIPPAKVSEDEFYTVFGECFHNNSRFSVKKPVPMLGDDNSPIEEVNAFYDFWFAFKSWRDFSYVDEHNVEEAECREEKRWMERENERERKKLKREEALRVHTLTERGMKNDPRLIRKKNEELAEKQRVKDAKIQAKKDAQKAKEDAERAAKEEEENKKKAADASKKATKKKKANDTKKFQKLVKGMVEPFLIEAVSGLSTEHMYKGDFDWLLGRIDLEKLTSFKEGATAIGVAENAEFEEGTALPESVREATVELMNTTLLETETRGGYDRFGNPVKKAHMETKKEEAKENAARNAAAKAENTWTEAELAALTKGVAQFPQGCFNRWESISNLIGTKNPDQVLKQVKAMTSSLSKPSELKQGDAKSNSVCAEKKDNVWTKGQQSQLEAAIKCYKEYKEKDKWELIAEQVEGKDKKECVERYKYLASLVKKK